MAHKVWSPFDHIHPLKYVIIAWLSYRSHYVTHYSTSRFHGHFVSHIRYTISEHTQSLNVIHSLHHASLVKFTSQFLRIYKMSMEPWSSTQSSYSSSPVSSMMIDRLSKISRCSTFRFPENQLCHLISQLSTIMRIFVDETSQIKN